MNINFWKMHGAGNDFILVDDRDGTFPAQDRAWVARVCTRRTGVGSEGLILIRSSDKADFQMQFFNPDGAEAEMCGNGARCVALLANEIGAAPSRMQIDTEAGIVRAEVLDRDVRLELTPPCDLRLSQTLQLDDRTISYGSANTGVPHVVVVTPDLAACDVAGLGRAIRYHEDFEPAGTNANFIQVTGPQAAKVRTYERGVEGETLACGTGIVAGALIAALAGEVTPPVVVTATGGDDLTVDFSLRGRTIENVSLLGPAAFVCKGTLDYSRIDENRDV